MNEKFLTELQAQATWAIEAEKRKVNPTAKFDPAITPQQALELVACVRESEQLREEREPWQRCFQAEFLSWREATRERDDLQAKLDALLTAAKRPYALSDLDRMFLRRLEFAGEELTRGHKSECECPDCEETRALTAALNLAGPRFTRDECEELRGAMYDLETLSEEPDYDPLNDWQETKDRRSALLAKLDAYLEGLDK